jgi:MFS family permease
MQGLAAAGAVPAALGILGANYGPGRRKNKVFASFSAGNPIGAAFGLILGGLLTSYVTWRWMMWIIGIFQALTAVGAFLVIPWDKRRRSPDQRIDFAGAILVTSGLVLFCFGLTDAGNAPNKWGTWYIIFCLIIGLVLIGTFVFVESRVKSPLMPLSIWRVPQFGKLMLCFGLGFGAFGGSMIYGYSLYYQQIYQASPITVWCREIWLI